MLRAVRRRPAVAVILVLSDSTLVWLSGRSDRGEAFDPWSQDRDEVSYPSYELRNPPAIAVATVPAELGSATADFLYCVCPGGAAVLTRTPPSIMAWMAGSPKPSSARMSGPSCPNGWAIFATPGVSDSMLAGPARR
jgi:hypothetical protein